MKTTDQEIAEWLSIHPDNKRINSDISTWKGLLMRCNGMCADDVRVFTNTERGRKAMGKHVIRDHAGMRSDVQTVFVNNHGQVIIVLDEEWRY